MSNVNVNTGSTFGISATLPTTYDNNATTGYTPITFTDVAEVIDLSEIAKVWAIIKHQSLGRAYPENHKDTYDVGPATITLGRYLADAGQALLKTAHGSSASYSFEIAMPSGDVLNFTGKVTKNGLGSLTSGGFNTTLVEIAIDAQSIFEA